MSKNYGKNSDNLLSLYPSFALPSAWPHFGIKANLAKARKINLNIVYCKSSCRC